MQRLLISLGALCLVACTSGAVGSRCHGGAATNDCAEGAICTLERSEFVEPPTNPSNEQFFCRTICDVEANCEIGFSCRQAAGTMYRSCQPDEPLADAGM